MANKFYNNLISHWLMNDDLATTAVLDSKGSNDGTLEGGNNTEDISVAGKINKALDFDGTDDYINCGNNASLDSLTNFTYSVWIYPTTIAPSYQLIIGKDGQWDKGFFVSGSAIKGFISRATKASYSYSGGGILEVDKWYHIVMVCNDTDKKVHLYINGEEITYAKQDTGEGAVTHYVANPILISSSLIPFVGKIDDVRIYNTAITADYVKLLYNNGAGTEDENVQHHNLVSHWLMNDDLATTAVLDTTGVNDGVLNVNTDTISVAGKINKALDFDGVDDYVSIPDDNTLDLTTDGSISLWIYIDAYTNYPPIIQKGNAGGGWSTESYSIWLRDAPNIIAELNDGAHNTNVSFGAPSIEKWHHLVMTFDGSNLKTYVDGVYINSAEQTYNALANTKALEIGSENFNGKIDDVRIYNEAISPYYIKLLYNNGAGTEDENIQANALHFGCNF